MNGAVVRRVLVTGGAGYIGSHTAHQLVAAGHRVVVLDNLCSGHRWAVPPEARFEPGDVIDQALVKSILRRHRIDAVIHFAGHVVVPESVENPGKYYRNNVVGSLNLIEACIDGGVDRFVFSSSAAVYGEVAGATQRGAVSGDSVSDDSTSSNLISENAITAPINPYGTSKLITEWTLRDLAAAHDRFRFVALRYFNVAGARLDGTLGQATAHATHLIKVACEAACGTRAGVSVFGDDYPTPDGTCIRDYLHVEDLARAHLDAFDYLDGGGPSITLNCGYGRGHSVAQVLECVRAVSGVNFAVTIAPRRAGDPPELVADNALIRARLGWKPRHDDLATICRTAYRWEQALLSR